MPLLLKKPKHHWMFFIAAALISVFFATSALADGAETSGQEMFSSETRIGFKGYVENPEFYEFVENYHAKNLSIPLSNTGDRKVAVFINIFVSSRLVEDGEIVRPDGAEIDAQDLSFLRSSIDSFDLCQTGKWIEDSEDRFVVAMFDGSPTPRQEDLEHCFYVAVALALGEDPAHFEQFSREQLASRVETILAEMY